jgi:putative acetyltransferase
LEKNGRTRQTGNKEQLKDNNDMMTIKRTTSINTDFHLLIKELDKDLLNRYGQLQQFFNQFNKIENNPNVVIAYINEEAVGCGCFKPFEEGSVEIKRMYVKAEWRGKGVGAMIMVALENWAAESDFEYTVLETGYEQPEAIHLYKKQGYDTIPNYGPYIGNEEYSVCMKKRIK